MEFESSSIKQLQDGYELNLLIVEDNPIDADVVERYISSTFPNSKADTVISLTDAKQSLFERGYDFIVLDLNLPDSKGLNTLDEVILVAQNIPVLIYTSIEDTTIALQAIERGAQDYLLKGRGDEMTLKRVIQYSLVRKNYEQRLWHSEVLLRTFVQHCPAGIVVLDCNFNVQMASDRWKHDFCVAFNEGQGNALTTLFPAIKDAWPALLERVLHGDIIPQAEEHFVSATGTEEYMKRDMMPWHNEHGAIGGIIIFMELITERFSLLKALKDSKATLKQKVADRTSKLEVALHELSKAQMAKTEFFTNITHELRTPLHAIMNFSTIGKRKVGEVDEDRIREYFDDIHASGERLLGLVNDVLDISKNQSGKLTISYTDQSLGELFVDVERELSGILENNHIRLVYELDDAIGNVLFDKEKIYQVLTNLLANAIKFSPQDTHITVSAHKALVDRGGVDADAIVVVCVQDQGDGIPEADLENVFDEFKQSDKIRSGGFSIGTGLGLAICRQIIDAHGGEIWAKNAEEGGAGIYFTLPLETNKTD